MESTDRSRSLLASLSAAETTRVLDRCDSVALLQGEVLTTVGTPLSEVFFPIDCVIALFNEGGRHQALAVDLAGAESMIGSTLLLGRRHASLRAQVLCAGRALRMDADAFLQTLREVPRLGSQLMTCLDLQQAQYAQVAACTAFHVLERRLAWWLLMTHDRVSGDRFELTQDLLAAMLGVRRSGVTRAAVSLKDRKLIGYSRGRIVVRDRKGLEQAACVCYRLMHAAQQRLLPTPMEGPAVTTNGSGAARDGGARRGDGSQLPQA